MSTIMLTPLHQEILQAIASKANSVPKIAGAMSTAWTTPAKLTFVNAKKSTRRIYWLSYAGTRTLYGALTPGANAALLTFVTHPWVITDTSDKCIEVFQPVRGASSAINREVK